MERDHRWPKQYSWWQRLCSRVVARRLMEEGTSFQIFGKSDNTPVGEPTREFESVQAEPDELAHWILRSAGYLCCPADMAKLAGGGDD